MGKERSYPEFLGGFSVYKHVVLLSVLGTAFAFNILLKIPVWAGAIVTVFSTLLLLGVQRFGVRENLL
jgi:Mn2+/Fe2+ NRAMP family transporter